MIPREFGDARAGGRRCPKSAAARSSPGSTVSRGRWPEAAWDRCGRRGTSGSTRASPSSSSVRTSFGLQEARRRFEREAKAAAFLKSAHVVQIHDYGVEGDLPYLVMELLTGEDLGERLKRRERLTPRETASIVTQVARALRRAADAGIVHRDLKPSNVFIVAGDDDEELVKVLDFGIAKAPRLDTTEQTSVGAIIGSPRYMSPEQARASPLVDPRSDLWSLGVIAYRALTGVYPFDSKEMTDLIVKICTETPVPPSALDPSLDPEMDAFFVRALARDPAERFQTAREMAAAFALAAGEPPSSMTSRSLLRTMLPEPPSPRASLARLPYVERVPRAEAAPEPPGPVVRAVAGARPPLPRTPPDPVRNRGDPGLGAARPRGLRTRRPGGRASEPLAHARRARGVAALRPPALAGAAAVRRSRRVRRSRSSR